MKMAFALTKYIYPIESEIKLSEYFDFTLDNPRSQQEFELIKNFISNSENKNPNPHYNQGFSIALAFEDFKKYLSKINDEYASNYFKSQPDVSVIDLISWSWIIIRYNDENEFEIAQGNKDELLGLILRQKENPFVKNFDQLRNYSFLLSLLLQDDEYYVGDSILFSEDPAQIFTRIDSYKIHNQFEQFKNQFYAANSENIFYRKWLFYPNIRDKIINISTKINEFLNIDKLEALPNKKDVKISQKQTPNQKLMFIGDLLKIIDEINDIKVKLMLLVSIIEFILTRNPNFDRFNVEDSISKQFKLKTAVLIFQNDKTKDLNKIHTDLDTIYRERSNIAHGNYIEPYNIDQYIDLVHTLYDYIKAIVEEYLKNRNFIDYLKDN